LRQLIACGHAAPFATSPPRLPIDVSRPSIAP
jgi:hypothetical protein